MLDVIAALVGVLASLFGKVLIDNSRAVKEALDTIIESQLAAARLVAIIIKRSKFKTNTTSDKPKSIYKAKDDLIFAKTTLKIEDTEIDVEEMARRHTALATDVARKREREIGRALILLGIVGSIYYGLSLFGVYDAEAWALIFIATPSLAALLDYNIVKFRVRNGLYGTNEYEAREMLLFLENDVPPDDRGQYKQIVDRTAFEKEIQDARDAGLGGQVV